jgi:hypothetical protein
MPISNDREDKWQNRHLTMTCVFCVWYLKKKSASPDSVIEIGRCRRHAPTMNGFPAVYPMDWCGDHKLDENKL